jgi:uncharacterized protein (TIGR00725 family)
MRILAIVGPGETATAAEVGMAERLAELAVRDGWVILCGGRAQGIMAGAARGAARGGGISIGLLPTSDRSGAAPELTVALATGLGEARNAVLARSCDAMAVCGMSAGTASEVALAAKAGKLVVMVGPAPLARDFFRNYGSRVANVASVEEAVELIRTSS